MKNKKSEKISFRFEIDKNIWEKFKLTVPPNMSIKDAIIMLIVERVKEIWGDEWDK